MLPGDFGQAILGQRALPETVALPVQQNWQACGGLYEIPAPESLVLS